MNLRRWIERICIYVGAIVILGALLYLAQVYARMSQEQLEKTRNESVALSDGDETRARVKVCRVFEQKLTDVLPLPGTVEAYEDINLAVKIGGAIEWIAHEEGEPVRKGEKLLQLDTAMLQAQLARARSTHDLAMRQHERTKDLFEKNVASRQAFDSTEATSRTTRAALTEATVALRNGTLLSPIDGVIDRRHVDSGEFVAEGETVMKIVNTKRVKIWFNIPEKDVLYFEAGRPVRLLLSNGTERYYTGTIEYVALTADQPARTYPLKVVIDNADGQMRPGMIVYAFLVRRQVEKGIGAPIFSVIDKNDRGKSVFIADEKGIARERPVELGLYQDAIVHIRSGLAVGDALIVTGQRDLVDGQRVDVTNDLTEEVLKALASGKDFSKIKID